MIFSLFKKPSYMIDYAKPQDASAIAKLHKASFAHGWSGDDILGMISSQNTLALVVRDSKGGLALGFLIIRYVLDEAEILSIAIDKSIRRQALGAKLIEKSLPFLVQKQVKKLFLEVASDNLAAIKLYQNFHFTQISVRKNYYKDVNGIKDALLMQRIL